MKKTIVSTNRLMILAMMMVMTISANAARPLVACYQRDARMQVTSEDADKEYVLPLYMPFKRTWGILRNEVPFFAERICGFVDYISVVLMEIVLLHLKY